MSIVSLSSSSESNLNADDVKRLAQSIGITIDEERDVQDYLLLLKSFEAVTRHVETGPDYLHPSLLPQPTIEPRKFWKPSGQENPLNAWSHRCHLIASNPTSRLLEGRIVAIKDNISIAGLPTTVGTFNSILSPDGELPVSPIDATVVARLLAAGAIVKGSSTCENFCASPGAFSSATGPVHHPLAWGYTTGGSSSGSCALVAANAILHKDHANVGETAELAIGGDQAGSVRIPAAYTGLYGLKPTFGLVPYTGAASMSPMIDHLGPIASNIDDVTALLQVMAGYDGLDSRMSPESPMVDQVKDYPALVTGYRESLHQGSYNDRDRGCRPVLKVGILTESFTIEGLSPPVSDGVLKAARTYFSAAGAEVVDISIPMHLEGPIIWTAATRPSISNFLCQGKPSGHLSYLPPHIQTQWPPTQDMYELLTSTNPAVVNIILSAELARTGSGSNEAKAHRKVFELRTAYDKALEEVDVLITPCAPSIATPHPRLIDEQGNRTSVMEKLSTITGVTNNTCPFNVTGHPALSVPAGRAPMAESPYIEMPFGMQIVGRRWRDEDVLRAAVVFEYGRGMVDNRKI